MSLARTAMQPIETKDVQIKTVAGCGEASPLIHIFPELPSIVASLICSKRAGHEGPHSWQKWVDDTPELREI